MRIAVASWAVFVSFALSLTASEAALQFQADSTSDGLRFIVASGDFGASDDLRPFAALVVSSQARFVTFNSPGGNIYKAMELGRLIRGSGLSTIQLRASQCASACALAFLGGVRRGAEPGSIGVHQSSFDNSSALSRDEAVSGVQHGTADVIAYLVEMGIDPALLQVALSYDSADMRYLSGSEMTQYRVTTDTPSETSPPVASTSPDVGTPAPGPTNDDAKARVEQEVLSFVKTVVLAHARSQPEALPTLLDSYADYVQYYGKRTAWLDVLHDKESYFRRWPQRSYQLRDDTVSVLCRVFACEVTGEYDWAVQSLSRNKRASGTASFHYVIDVSHGLRIIDESSQVLSR